MVLQKAIRQNVSSQWPRPGPRNSSPWYERVGALSPSFARGLPEARTAKQPANLRPCPPDFSPGGFKGPPAYWTARIDTLAPSFARSVSDVLEQEFQANPPSTPSPRSFQKQGKSQEGSSRRPSTDRQNSVPSLEAVRKGQRSHPAFTGGPAKATSTFPLAMFQADAPRHKPSRPSLTNGTGIAYALIVAGRCAKPLPKSS